MTVLRISIDEENDLKLVKEFLGELPSVKIEEETDVVITETPKAQSASERIKKILEEAKGKDLFKDIEDPSEWQREIRKEWDRDF
ncbi:hypothetical protein BDD43_5830 [Mucilaginibacter gracilis]|uniref:Uncharacterized protein n=1 Tax=Mucilaginibacter gracilis TaxID=423350 RepID=A0A495JBX0_9SPHI|nr:hypothetical protein [Mucilaginibacter gracilis]RKR85559.1 hypothetical protein BDD43_5830 [Mucilaginibacter gracilis]